MMRDYTDKPLLCDRWCYISFGSKSASGSDQTQKTENAGLAPAQKTPLSQFVGPALQDLYSYASSYLYPTQPQIPAYQITSSAYGGPKAGQQADSVYDAATGALIGPSTMAVDPRTGKPFSGTVGDPTKAAEFHPFTLPGIDKNGLYAGQNDAIPELLRRAGLNLNTSTTGMESGVLQNALPQLFDTIGKQTVGQVEIPEQVRQKRVQDVNAVLQLVGAGLGSSSAGSGSRNFSSSSTNFGLLGGKGGQAAAAAYNAPAGKGLSAAAAVYCWIAMELYGPESIKVVMVRRWLSEQAEVSRFWAWVVRLYRRYGQAVAAWLHQHPSMKRMVKPLFDAIVRRARHG